MGYRYKDKNKIHCGGREIRTPEGRKPLTVFKTAAFNHSAIPPQWILLKFVAKIVTEDQ